MTDKEKLNKLKELADKMAHSSEYLLSDASYLHKAVYEYRQFIVQHWNDKEPLNEGLEEGQMITAEIGYWNQRGLSIRLDKDLENLGFDEDTKVKVLIIKEDEE